jgi:diketogulonate reductase-like aldo/keto reductase
VLIQAFQSAGVSNFRIEDLEEIRNAGLEMPVVNQILLHPYVYGRTAELLNYHVEHGIATEAYSTLIPITHQAGGPLDKPLQQIAKAHKVDPGQILMAWAKAKGAVVLSWVSTVAKEPY